MHTGICRLEPAVYRSLPVQADSTSAVASAILPELRLGMSSRHRPNLHRQLAMRGLNPVRATTGGVATVGPAGSGAAAGNDNFGGFNTGNFAAFSGYPGYGYGPYVGPYPYTYPHPYGAPAVPEGCYFGGDQKVHCPDRDRDSNPIYSGYGGMGYSGYGYPGGYGYGAPLPYYPDVSGYVGPYYATPSPGPQAATSCPAGTVRCKAGDTWQCCPGPRFRTRSRYGRTRAMLRL